MALKKRLIPALLLREGRCVKGRQFANFRDTGNPLTAARVYDAQGADELVFLDITASSRGHATTVDVIHHVAEEVFMPLCVGGGLRTVEDIREMLEAGADKVSLNTAVEERPELIAQAARRFGNQCVVVSIDCRRAMTAPTRCSPTPAPAPRAATRSSGRARPSTSGRARSSSRRSTGRERWRATTSSSCAPSRTRSRCRSSPTAAAARCTHLVEAIVDGHADAVSCASILHFTDQSVIKARAHMKTYGVDVRIA